jgi:hypothetical protein
MTLTIDPSFAGLRVSDLIFTMALSKSQYKAMSSPDTMILSPGLHFAGSVEQVRFWDKA